ncbi:hypothetical protein DFH28DRAFT_923554 [Melampsora americana]|nr:hypothetical protein DFH28DRAFT_923554 [Melampsora americana]
MTDLATQITEQRAKVGNSDTLRNLSQPGQDCFLKLWFAKTEVRTRFLALRAEQRPLDPENRVGGSSRLGTHEKERIMQAIERRSQTMKKTLNNYNCLAREFEEKYPDHQASPPIEYLELIQKEADDHFWNDGIFTHLGKPWAVDCGTQLGMRALARFKRGKEELRRLGWEVRRAMRWSTKEHTRLWDILNDIKVYDVNQPSDLIQHFLSNEVLASLPNQGKIEVGKGLLHNAFVKITTLCIYWDDKAMEVMMRTPAQLGDLELMTLWKTQLNRITHLRALGFASSRLGDFENLFETVKNNDIINVEEQNRPVVPILDNHDEVEWGNGIDQEWENGINEGMLMNMMANVALEREDHLPVLAF